MARLEVTIDPRRASAGADVVKRDLADIKRRAREVERGTDRMGRNSQRGFREMSRGADVANRGIRSLINQVKILGATMVASLGVSAIIRTADAFTELTNRLRVAGVALEDMSETQGQLFEIANQNGVAIGSLAQLYSRASIAADELGASEKELMDFVRGTAAALRVQGGSTSAASGALLQLSQSLGSGIVRAEEFNSILEGALPIAQAAARGIEGMEGSVAKLRQAIVDGEITSQVFFDGLLKGFTATEALAAGLELTVGQALTVLNNSFTRFIGAMDEATGVSGGLSSAIQELGRLMDFLAQHLETITRLAKIAGAALLTAFGPALLRSVQTIVVAIGTGLVGALRAVAVAAAANPLGAFIVGLVTAITAVWQFRDEVKSALAEVNAEIEQQLGINAAVHAKRGSNDMMNAFRAAFDVVSTTWRQLPGVVAGAAIGGVNAVNRWTSRMVQSAINGINTVIEAVNTLPETFGFEGLSTIPDFGGLPQVPNPWAETVQTWMDDVNNIVDQNMSRDWFEEARASASETAPVVEDLSTNVNELVGKLDEAAAAAAGAGTAGKAATDEMDAGLSDLAAKAGEVSDGVWGRMRDEAVRTGDEIRNVARGFTDDLLSAMRSGETGWRTYANIALNALDSIVDKLLNDVLDALFEVNKASAGSGGSSGGGILGSLVGGILGAFSGSAAPSSSPTPVPRPSAMGNALDQGRVLEFARGGIVSRPTIFPMADGAGIMGEAGPEAIMPLTKTSEGTLGVQAFSDTGGPATVLPLERGPSGKLGVDLRSVDEDTVVAAAKGAVVTFAHGGVIDQAPRMMPPIKDRALSSFAKGDTFEGDRITTFARGDVVMKPTLFPMANGETGLMGEAGPEAVMPLVKTATGQLGVQAFSDMGGEPMVLPLERGADGKLGVDVASVASERFAKGGVFGAPEVRAFAQGGAFVEPRRAAFADRDLPESGKSSEPAQNVTIYEIDATGADPAAIARLDNTIRELAGPGKVERRAVAAVSTAQHRGQRLGPRG